MARIMLLLLALLTIGASAPGGPGKPFQRVVLSPGCYVIAAGGYYDVSAYCLDESIQAPAPGTSLAAAPSNMGKTVIKIGAAASSLQTAMQRGTIRLEGLGGGDYFHVRVRNLTAGKIEICVTSPTVLMGDDGYPTMDLERAFPQIADVVGQTGNSGQSNGTADLETHLKIQKRIWEIMAAAWPKPSDADSGWPGPSGIPKQGLPAPRDCAGPPNSLVLCPQ